ncbi:MAG: hypothetical protein HS100_02405 [Anaerolineales bacterium]|nr:hypothetical protein [Anaerolineales bacterium]
MKPRSRSILHITILILFTLACGLENIQVVESPNLEATITAQALILQQNGQPPAPVQEQVIVVVTATGEGGAAAPPSNEQVNPAQVLPPASGAVTVTVTTATNCRLGPGQNFKIVYGMPVGQVAKVVAKNSYSGYWIIEIPGQAGQTCWLWGQYAVINGDTSTLKEVVTPTSPAPTITNTPKPTLTPTATTGPAFPAAPSGLTASISCAAGPGPTQWTVNGNMSWADNSNNELVFVASVDGVSSKTLAANSTSDSFSVVMENANLINATPNQQFTVFVYACSDNTAGSCGNIVTIKVTGAGCP